jgi:threonyl-tRNA synthetase
MVKNNIQLGRERDIFSIHEESGSGLPLFHPDGALLRLVIIEYLRKINSGLGFREVWTPHLFNADLWKRSGHYEAYKSRMFLFKIGDHEYGLKPMNCPAHSLIFASRPRSYRDLPVMFSEFATVYRNEQEGELTGLLRVRSITQDDGHVFLSEDQVEDVFQKLINAATEVLRTFGLTEISIAISTRPSDAIGSDELWEKATQTLIKVASESGLKYTVAPGEGAFYGPKIDLFAFDSLGRSWQLSTLQLDFNLGERLGLRYTAADGTERHPLIIHRALAGSLERFIGILLEHYQGNLPSWLSPTQIRVMAVSEKHARYAKSVYEKIHSSGIRCDLDDEDMTLPKRIRRAATEGIPYVIITGEDEETSGTVSLRARSGEQLKGCRLTEVINALLDEIFQKKNRLEVVKSLSSL